MLFGINVILVYLFYKTMPSGLLLHLYIRNLISTMEDIEIYIASSVVLKRRIKIRTVLQTLDLVALPT